MGDKGLLVRFMLLKNELRECRTRVRRRLLQHDDPRRGIFIVIMYRVSILVVQ